MLGFTWTFVLILGARFSISTPMNGSEAFLSISILNFADGWQWFRVSRKVSADAVSGMMVKVSSTYCIAGNRRAICLLDLV